MKIMSYKEFKIFKDDVYNNDIIVKKDSHILNNDLIIVEWIGGLPKTCFLHHLSMNDISDNAIVKIKNYDYKNNLKNN